MRKLFNEILNLEGVKGIMLFSFSGELVFEAFASSNPAGSENRDWKSFIESLKGIRETDVIFEKGRLYIRKTDIGYLMVLMGRIVSTAMLRLNCDILLPSLKPAKTSKGFGRFFRR